MKRFREVFLMTSLLIVYVGIVNASAGFGAVSSPDFSLIDSNITETGPGEYQFTAIVKNNGDPATAGTVPVSWEKVIYDLTLEDGAGTLVESDVDLDLNGDGDTSDSFDVTWFHNDTRNWDAIINDGIQDIHAYSFWEGPPEDRKQLRTYYINGEPKLIKLGSETHTLLFADNNVACFGLGDAQVSSHPNANFEVIFEHAGVQSNLSAKDFELNGSPVEVDKTWEQLYYPFSGEGPIIERVYVVPNQNFIIDSGETVTFSCTITAHESVTCDVYLIVNWSPDGNTRDYWIPVFQEDETFEISGENGFTTPSYTLLTVLSMIAVISFYRKSKKAR